MAMPQHAVDSLWLEDKARDLFLPARRNVGYARKTIFVGYRGGGQDV
jgi:hypothetical protein